MHANNACGMHCRAGNTARLLRNSLPPSAAEAPTWLCSSATTSWLTPAECPASSPTCTHAAAAQTGTHGAGRAQRCGCTLSETEAERLQRQPASQAICSLSHTLRFTLPLGCHSSTLRSTPPLQRAGLSCHYCSAGTCAVPACSAPRPNICSTPACPSTSCTCVPQPSPLAQPPPTWPPARRRGSIQRCARACGADPQRPPACGAPGPAWPAWHLSWKTPGPRLGGEMGAGKLHWLITAACLAAFSTANRQLQASNTACPARRSPAMCSTRVTQSEWPLCSTCTIEGKNKSETA